MKKFTKICLFTSLFLILIGTTICVIGSVSGGWKLARSMSNQQWRDELDRIGGIYWWEQWDDDWDELENMTDDWADDVTEKSSHNGKQAEKLEEVKAEKVKDLEINIGGASLYVQESEGNYFGFASDGKGKYSCYESGGVLHVESERKRNNVVINSNERIVLTIPKGMVWNDVVIEVGAGLVKLPKLTADEIELHIGAGKAEAEGMVGTSLLVETGAGTSTLKNVSVQELDLEVGMGECNFQGEVKKEIQADCGMGKMQLELTGSEEDFNYDISCAMGTVHIGGRSYSALADDTYIDNDAEKECSVECAMGTVEITYE